MSHVFKRAEDDKAILTIEYDTDAQNPRKDMDGWIGKMVCWHRRYNLGDDHNFSEPEDFFRSLAEEYKDTPHGQKVLRKLMREEFKDVKPSRDDDGTWFLEKDGENYDYGRYFETKKQALEHLRDKKDEWLYYAMDELTMAQCKEIFSPFVVMLPLYLYDHSGITMSTGAFSCPWDSGQVGWIYAAKEDFIKETGYTKDELFNTDKHRKPKKGERVKVKGYEDRSYDGFGQVVSISKDNVVVDFDYNKALDFRKPENRVTVPLSDVNEVMANQAEQMLVGEVEIYDQYLRGDVYGFILEEKAPCHCGNPECGEVEIKREDSCWGFYGSDPIENGMADHIPKEYHHLFDLLDYAS